MQTFLPYADFDDSMQALDDARLGRQRTEAIQLLSVLEGLRWNIDLHTYEAILTQKPQEIAVYWGPVGRMWRDYHQVLVVFAHAACNEWTSRGHHCNIKDRLMTYFPLRGPLDAKDLPLWFGRESVHSAHRSILLGKDYDYYHERYGWIDPPMTHENSEAIKAAAWPH